MKSKQEQLKSRGFLAEGLEHKYINISVQEKHNLLTSTIATNRTLGARLLKEYKTDQTVHLLIKALTKEKKLYSKIEICNTLIELDEITILPLITCLGQIGNNQHKTVPEKEFLKDSYPLPRDIVSRTLIRIGSKAIPKLLNNLKTKNLNLLSELIDTIGHIHFNSKTENIYQPLAQCYHHYKEHSLIQWKIIRAMSGVSESESFLKEQLHQVKNIRIQKEINRSLRLLKQH